MNDHENDSIKENLRIYERCRDDLLKRQLSNAENFDKAILAYSSAGLGFSVTFLKGLTDKGHPYAIWMLLLSWVLFSLSIISTIASYVASQKAIIRQLQIAQDYYQSGNHDAYSAKNSAAQVTEWLNISSGLLFAVAIILTVVFACLNVEIGSTSMKEELTNAAGIPVMQKLVSTQDGAPVPSLQRGAPIPTMQAVARPAAPQQPTDKQPPSK